MALLKLIHVGYQSCACGKVGESFNAPQPFIVVVRCNKADDQTLKTVYVLRLKVEFKSETVLLLLQLRRLHWS